MRVVALEEHYATQRFLEGPGRSVIDRFGPGQSHPRFGATGGRTLVDRLCDVAGQRVAEMDEAGVDVQVLSLTSPGLEQAAAAESVAAAREVNDFLAEAIRHHPTRLAGFATLPTADPAAAAEELERAAGLQGVVGAVINGHCQGRHLDDEFFWPIFERLEGLDLPFYLHPTVPPHAVVQAVYAGNYPQSVADIFATTAWGWHIETATHVLRLILGGVFDRYPRLQVIIGHMGEALPFMMPRIDVTLPPAVTSLHRAPSDYLRHNVHYTFSGFNWTSAFLELLFQVGTDRIMFSTDYPYASMTEATAFLASVPISPADRERIAHGNADRLLRF